LFSNAKHTEVTILIFIFTEFSWCGLTALNYLRLFTAHSNVHRLRLKNVASFYLFFDSTSWKKVWWIKQTSGKGDVEVEYTKCKIMCSTKHNSHFCECFLSGNYEGWNFNSGNYLFTTDTK